MIDEILAFAFVACIFLLFYFGYRAKMKELDEEFLDGIREMNKWREEANRKMREKK